MHDWSYLCVDSNLSYCNLLAQSEPEAILALVARFSVCHRRYFIAVMEFPREGGKNENVPSGE
jgi:hypothetical protein